MEHHVGLEEVFGSGRSMVIGNFHEDSSGETDILTGGDNDSEAWFLHEFHGLPLGVASYCLLEPLISDCRAIQMAGRHQGKLEEQCHSSV